MTVISRLGRSSTAARVAIMLFGAILVLIVLIPQLPGSDPYTQDLGAAIRPPSFTDPAGVAHILGTDALGRDLLSRLGLAGRVSFFIAGSAVLLSLVVGTTLGLIAGYVGGIWDAVISAASDIQLSLPRFLLLISVIALFGPTLPNLALTLGLTGWVAYARVARSQTMSLRAREFVDAARVIGASPARILLRHILPNELAPTLILASFDVGQVIILEASLSYIGLGVQPPLPAWGSMVHDGEAYLRTSPLLMVIPGLAIFFAVAGVNLLTQQFTSETSRYRASTSS